MYKPRYTVWLFAFCVLASCDFLDDSPCGPNTRAEIYLLGSSLIHKDNINTYTEGNNRVFQWGELVEHVCADEHIKSEFRVALKTDKSAQNLNLKARGRISYQFLYEKSVELQLSREDLKGSLDVGIKHAFPDLNGWYAHYVEIYFPTKGSLAEDEKFLFPRGPNNDDFLSEIIAVEINSKYREYK